MGAPGLIQARLDIGALLPDGGGEPSGTADRTLHSRHAMGNAPLHHRLAKAKFSSTGGELYAKLLESMIAR